MKSLLVALFLFFIGSLFVSAQPFVGTYYAPGPDGGILISLKEERGLFSGTLRMGKDTYQVQCREEEGFLVGQILGKPIQVSVGQKGDRIDLTLVDLKWGALPDESTARSYVLTLQGETSSAAANYVQVTEGGVETVVFNGQVLGRRELDEFYKKYKRYPRPGNYRYDPMSGLYGAVGYDAFGYMHPGHKFGSLQASVSRGTSDYFINGRCLSRKELLIWNKLLGQKIRPGRYRFDSDGNFGVVGRRDHMFNLFKLGRAYETPEEMRDNFWAAQFGRGRKGANNRDELISVPGFGPEGYGFDAP